MAATPREGKFVPVNSVACKIFDQVLDRRSKFAIVVWLVTYLSVWDREIVFTIITNCCLAQKVLNRQLT